MVTIDPARQFYKDYRFSESVTAYRRQLRDAPDDWANIAGMSHSLMAMGAYAEAIPYLEKVDKYYTDLNSAGPGCQIELSICHWMIGKREAGLEIIKGLVIGVRDGKIHFTDIAGGVKQGLILSYMAATLHARSDTLLARAGGVVSSGRPYIRRGREERDRFRRTRASQSNCRTGSDEAAPSGCPSLCSRHGAAHGG
jgi:hypothetical protein